jgi:hypothetical protein
MQTPQPNSIRYGTFGGKNITPTSIKGTAQLAPKNIVGVPNAGTRVYAQIGSSAPPLTPSVSPNTDTLGTSDRSKIVTTTNPKGTELSVNTGDTPVSHVTPDMEVFTPAVRSRANNQWEGNITGNTAPNTARVNSKQRIRPQFGLSPAGSLNGNG